MVGKEALDCVGLVRWKTVHALVRAMKVGIRSYGNILLKPPPEKITSSQALSGSFTVFPVRICVAPTEVTNGQVDCGSDQ